MSASVRFPVKRPVSCMLIEWNVVLVISSVAELITETPGESACVAVISWILLPVKTRVDSGYVGKRVPVVLMS